MNEVLATQIATANELIEFTQCDRNIETEYIERALKLATDGDLTSCIGVPLLNALKWKIYNNTLGDFQSELLDNFIKPFLFWKALKIATVDMTFKLNNAGVYSDQDTNKEQATYNTTQRMARTYETNASSYLMRLTRALNDNVTQITNTIQEAKKESNNLWLLQLNYYESKTPMQIL